MNTGIIIDGRTDTTYNILINRNRYLNLTFQCEVYSGGTFHNYFDFTAYTGASLIVKNNASDSFSPLSFSTADGSIELLTNGQFKLTKNANQLGLRAGDYVYGMVLNSPSMQKRAFLSGIISIIETVG